uniref:Nucleoporin Nup82 n=1 Tax=Kwoniella dejecticola CBS 10117 TaxID=1296121 RepID=A0A1A5ZXQ4_9TREE|nr:uncharacterized protein I303_07339 [Kwoniella dejecticola CBS 10117]OBR82578.1 hypothetical protein I303_07339 [Kwoniella dejecticola CBS 10117]
MAQTIPFSLPFLRSHSIFTPPSTSTSTAQDDDWELVEKQTDDLVGQKYSKMVMRDKDLLVAVGKEIRMMSLAGSEGWEVKNGKVGTYKTLKSPSLTFTIHHIILNPNGRQIAVVGHHQIVVLVLPKNSYSGSNGEVECRSIPIDEFQFSPSSNDIISKVSWHPWGEGGNSLWVLTADGKLREYDVLQPHDAVQTFNFLPSTSSSSTKFTAVDPLSRYATSFAFGPSSTVDFSPLMVYVLIANGDIYTMGPILPLHTEMPIRYLQGLKAYSETKLARIQGEARDVFGAGQAGLGRVSFQHQWVESLVKQVRLAEEARQRARDEISESPVSRRTSLLALLRQGPYVYSPAPQDIGNGDEDEEQAATDLLVSDVPPPEGQEGEGSSVIAIAWSGGRVDIGLEVDKPEPRWLSSRDPSTSTPVIPIIESVLLPFPQSDAESINTNAPTFLLDPLYRDVFYVQHSFGVDSISVRALLEASRGDETEDELPSSQVTRYVESGGSPVKPIVGMIDFCNINLGYGLVALASSGQAAFVELDIRISDSSALLPASSSTKEASVKLDEPDARSLLIVKPLDFDKLTSSVRNPSSPYNPLATLRQKIPDSAKVITEVKPDHLRVLGEISSQVRNRTQAIRSGSQAVENRLDLQVKELQRQIKLLRDCQNQIADLKKNVAINRAEELLAKQQDLGSKLDGVVQKLSEEFRPDIGDSERKWFDELERLKIRVRGGSGIVGISSNKGKALITRTQVLREQLDAIKPILAQSQTRQEDVQDMNTSQKYGSKQLKPLEAALGARSEELRRLMRRMEMLDLRVEAYGGAEDD